MAILWLGHMGFGLWSRTFWQESYDGFLKAELQFVLLGGHFWEEMVI